MQTIWPGIKDLNRWAQIKLYDTSNDVADAKVKELISRLVDNEQISEDVWAMSKEYGLPLHLIMDGTVKLHDCIDRDKLILYYQELIYLCVNNWIDGQ